MPSALKMRAATASAGEDIQPCVAALSGTASRTGAPAGAGRRGEPGPVEAQAQPLGVPVSSTSPGATLAKVDNSDRLGRLEHEVLRRIPLADGVIDRQPEFEVVEEGESSGSGTVSHGPIGQSRDSSCL